MRPEAGRSRARRRPARTALLAIGLAAALAAAGGAIRAADLTPQEQTESRLMCYCGCADLTVRVCNCGTAARIKEDIARRLASGETPDQVVAAYVRQYGEQIRSAPTKTGFNLFAWVTPFAVILAGAAMLVALTRRWRAQAAGDGPDAGSPAPDAEAPDARDRDTLKRIEREIREEY